jgi:MFS transporter, PPP family, 3-phenylpropionic acid transporter
VATLTFRFAADFADIFDVRGQQRARRDQFAAQIPSSEHVLLRYTALDGVECVTTVCFTAPPAQLDQSGATFMVPLEAGAGFRLGLRVSCGKIGPSGNRMRLPSHNQFIWYLALFGVLYAGFGVQSPYLPSLLQEHGLAAETIGTLLAAGTAIRVLAGPIAGRLADRFDAPRLVFGACAAAAAFAAIGYLPAWGFWPLLAVTFAQAAALAPLAPLCDSMVLASAGAKQAGFSYGWVRGIGSGAFIAGVLGSGQAIGRYGPGAVIWLNILLLGLVACYAPAVPRLASSSMTSGPVSERVGISELLHLRSFQRIVLVGALILGSHALHDSFAVIRWTAAGIGPGITGLLWAEAVAAEVIVFLFLGPVLLDRLGPARSAMLAAGIGALRWTISAQTAWSPAVAAIQPMHGITFALLHLALMRRLAETVPSHLSATALTLYGTVAIGAVTALMTLVSGWLYSSIGPQGFWVMAALCCAALPLARRL